MYGQMYEKIVVDSFRALEEPSHEIAQVLYMDLNNNSNYSNNQNCYLCFYCLCRKQLLMVIY